MGRDTTLSGIANPGVSSGENELQQIHYFGFLFLNDNISFKKQSSILYTFLKKLIPISCTYFLQSKIKKYVLLNLNNEI